MPTAHFSADFTKFVSAVTSAEVKLKSFEDGTAKAVGKLRTLSDSFSGRKILQDATVMTEAVERAGGAARLTATEQAKVGDAVTAALNKYKALGQEAPEALKNLDLALKKQAIGFKELATAAGAIGGVVTGAAAGIASLGSAGANVNDVRGSFEQLTEAIDESSSAILGKLREATLGNVSDTELMKTANLGLSQGLKLTAEQFGTMGDVAAVLADRVGGDVGNAFNTLTQAMTTGQDRTLKTIGLNIDAEAATAKYAAALGKEVSALDESEKKTAIKNAILEEGRRILAESGKAQLDFGDKVAGSNTKLRNFIDSVGAWVATSPSIGAWASTITAVSSTVTALGLAFGPLSAGIAKLIPMLGLSGLTGMFTTLAATISSTVMPLISTALPLAFKALAALFSVPAGLVIAGILAVVAVWKNWDTIGPIVANVYNAVKTWLVDKFAAVVESIRAKVGAVTGFFKDMYDKVVGNSYVPDMITGIADEFGKLGDIMINPTKFATDKVTEYFATAASRIGQIFGGQDSLLGRILTGGLSSLFGGPLMSIVSQGVGALVNLAWEGAKKIGSFFANIFGGSQPNSQRDDWFGGRGVQDIGDQLSPFMDGEAARKMIEKVFNAKTQKELDAATKAIDKILKGGGITDRQGHGFATGTRGKYLDFGAGTRVTLHGKERVMTEAEGRQENGMLVELQSMSRAMARRDRMLPRIMAMALKDAMAH